MSCGRGIKLSPTLQKGFFFKGLITMKPKIERECKGIYIFIYKQKI